MELLIWRHPVESERGLVRMMIEKGSFNLNCLWPLDRSSDEWFAFSIKASIDEWQKAFEMLNVTGEAVMLKPPRRLGIFVNPDGSLALDMELLGNPGTSLRLGDVGPLLIPITRTQ